MREIFVRWMIRPAATSGDNALRRKRHSSFIVHDSSFPPRGYTLVELLISTVLALIVMLGVVQVFGVIAQGVTDSRSTLEMTEAMRKTASMLKDDLAGVTVVMSPPRSPDDNEGYFEYTEGPIGPVVKYTDVAMNNDTNLPDTTVGDIDDMLMFTTRSRSEPFVGRFAGAAVESSDAEIAWFVRGRTLYRRVLLVRPDLLPAASGLTIGTQTAGFYASNDISAGPQNGKLVANTLGDLTKPENRFMHQPNGAGVWPFHPHFQTANTTVPWGTWHDASGTHVGLNLPTFCECSSSSSTAGSGPDRLDQLTSARNFAASGTFDAWHNPHPWLHVDPVSGNLSGYLGPRVAEDVVLNNVIGFDVKAWDPGAPVLSYAGQIILPGDPGYLTALNAVATNAATIVSYGAYVDLNYGCLAGGPGGCAALSQSVFAGPGVTGPPVGGICPNLGTAPGANPTTLHPAVYDTWSTHYEQTLGNGVATDGFDNDGNGVVDDPGEQQYPPPYSAPLRGIQIKIRCFEPTSRQVREVTVVQEFVTK